MPKASSSISSSVLLTGYKGEGARIDRHVRATGIHLHHLFVIWCLAVACMHATCMSAVLLALLDAAAHCRALHLEHCRPPSGSLH
jgi:hypothetical protein